VNNIKMDLKDIAWGSIGWIDLDQDRDKWRGPVNMLTNNWTP
jgi:hypothetical protein